MEETALIIFYCINLFLGFIGIIMYSFTISMRNKRLKVCLPRNLRIYMNLFCYPPCLILCLLSIITSFYYLIFRLNIETTNILIPIILAFFAQIFRVNLFIIVLERIIASIFIGKYNNNSNLGLALIIFFTGFLTVIYLIPFSMLASCFEFLQLYTTYFILSMHTVTLIICKLLYLINRKAYKSFAYQVSLKERYQILENVKVLSFIYPTIFIFTFIAPFGPLIIFIHKLITEDFIPPSLFHLSYNLAFIIMMIYRMSKVFQDKRAKLKPSPLYSIAVSVRSPLGKSLPINQQIDSYFKNLQKLWE